MAKGHRSQIKRERNEVKDARPSAKLSYARVSVQKACFVLDAIRGKDVATALAIVVPTLKPCGFTFCPMFALLISHQAQL